ncbi:hypothetical protein D0Z00_001007 [Geotrichum galactomycetum]|uniref:Uncharacterized protein n=1 Tax=Geotrichum galactomycetum TaxID=27317 RepID=A0ACB6V8D5_9ASCO|nr:hypothetical protein D0Z00_001007 [Geotrichum candidum]
MTKEQEAPEILGEVDYQNPLVGLEHVNVIPRDVFILSTPPSSAKDLHADDLSWEELANIIATNQLQLLKRRPHDLRNYLRWKHWVEQTRPRAGVLEFLVVERLHWVDELRSSDTVLEVKPPVSPVFMANAAEDLKILSNDFPYALVPGIVHVVVWTKTKIPVAENGDIAEDARTLIQKYVDATFTGLFTNAAEAKDRVLWFKNWAALQSIPALAHFHVLLRNPDMARLKQLYNTGGIQI